MQVKRSALPRGCMQTSAPRCAQRFSQACSAPFASRVTTTGMSPTKVVTKLFGSGSSASRQR